MAKHTTTRFVQHKIAQCLILRNKATLRPECFTGRRGDTTNDHIANLALGVEGYNMKRLAAALSRPQL